MPETLAQVAPQPTAESQEKIGSSPPPAAPKPPEKSKEEKDPFKSEREEFADKITKLFGEKKFYVDQDEFRTQLADEKRRYLAIVGKRIEEPGQLPAERFFKAPLPQRDLARQEKVDLSFRRQALAHAFLDTFTDFPVSALIEFNNNPDSGPTYAIMATYEAGAGVGFLKDPEDIKKLGEKHAQLAAGSIRELSHHEKEVKPDLAEVLEKRNAYQDYAGFLRSVTDILDKPVNGAGEFYSEDQQPLHEILERRTGIPGFREKALQLVQQLQPVIEGAQQGIHLVHGDLAPNNLFLGDGTKSPELMALDFEYMGISENEVLAAVYDFGNLRARAWNNEAFRTALDRGMIDSYKNEGREEVGRAIVALGILRSHAGLAGFFENYPVEKSSQPDQTERREATEKDIEQAWEIAREIKMRQGMTG